MYKTAIFCIVICLVIPCTAATLNVPLPYPTIQSAIDDANDLDTVIVAEGTYYENINFNGKNIILTSIDPADPNATVIDGSNSGSVVTFSGTETSACKLTGFTITNGTGTVGQGGGILGNGTQAIISNCFISGNIVVGNCSAGYSGGGGLYGCHGQIINCIITDNIAQDDYDECMWGGYGGGLSRCNATVLNCIISGNLAETTGGGLAYCDGPITNCLIMGNSAYNDFFSYGGGLAECNNAITNCTIFGNTAAGLDSWGGGLAECYGSITNCIIWANTAISGGDQIDYSSVPTYSCIQDWTGGGLGNITSDPNFADVSNDDYRLMSQAGRWNPDTLSWVTDVVTSPCIDAGNPGCPIGDEPNDIANVRINMGAYGGTTQASRTPAGWGLLCDVNNDWSVNTGDLNLFAGYWLNGGECIPADFSRDQTVNIFDFVHLYIEWLDVR